MRQHIRPNKAATPSKAWAQRLSLLVEQIMAAHPEANRDNVRHTLILLEQPPLERLRRSLIRGRASAVHRQKLKVLSLERILASKLAANRPKDKLTISILRDALLAAQAAKRRSKRKRGQ